MTNTPEDAVFSTAITTQQYTQALADLTRFFEIATRARDGRCASLIGPSGSGKSTIVTALSKKYPRTNENGKSINPILTVKIPSKPSIRSFYEALMKGLGGPILLRETNGSIRSRVLHFIKETGVRVIVLDEFQHLARKVGVDPYSICDTIKSLMDEGRIGIVFVGVPESDDVIQMDDQILTRRVMNIRLRGFCDTQNPKFHGLGGEESWLIEFQEFRSVLNEFSDGFGCPNTEYLCDDVVATSMLAHTNGVFRVIRDFVEAAANNARCRGRDGIDAAAIDEALRLRTANAKPLDLSPSGAIKKFRGSSKKPSPKVPKDEMDLRNANGEFTTRNRSEPEEDEDDTNGPKDPKDPKNHNKKAH
jgi:energy-coupling factor transporter ATP-binding protein EcfA2